MGFDWDGQRAALAGAVRHMLETGSPKTKLAWSNFLEGNPAQQGPRPERQTAAYLKGFLRHQGVTFASHPVFEGYGPALAAIAEQDEPQDIAPPSTAGYGSDVSSDSSAGGEQVRKGRVCASYTRTPAAAEAEDDVRSNASTVRAKRDGIRTSIGGELGEEAAVTIRADVERPGEGEAERPGAEESPAGAGTASGADPNQTPNWDPETPAAVYSPAPGTPAAPDAAARPAAAARTPRMSTLWDKDPPQQEAPQRAEAKARASGGSSGSGVPYQPSLPGARQPREPRAAWGDYDNSWWTSPGWEGQSWNRSEGCDDEANLEQAPWRQTNRYDGGRYAQHYEQSDPSFPPLYPNAQDPYGPPQLYKLPMAKIDWKKGNPQYGRQETSNEAVKRLQTDLGCYFVGGWDAYVEHHAGKGPKYNDPRKHHSDFTTEFLSHLMDAGGDIRAAMRNLGISVDWWKVQKDGKGKGEGKGKDDKGKNRPEGKGAGKRPSPDDEQSRATRPRHR